MGEGAQRDPFAQATDDLCRSFSEAMDAVSRTMMDALRRDGDAMLAAQAAEHERRMAAYAAELVALRSLEEKIVQIVVYERWREAKIAEASWENEGGR